ncbi:hypothetical protein ACFO1B_01205 [Dactylosporangium siamense]|uniref:Uncharacterized protein n=1 Tax=Dactylosporangium siamense TaxID=685454 RepID=A0A919PDQ5_9ACTN|nr:hypothetical protein [Dactylosporangium siamense]GIG42029.1 hypothetical protein Dsi01nite_000700 [Dactylosporangium siamense]
MTSISGISGISGSFATAQTQLRPPPPRDGKDPMAAVSKALGLSGDELKTKLDGGQSLTEVAEEQGVSHEDLIAAIKAGKPSDTPAAVSRAATSAEEDGDAAAEQIAAQKGRPGPPPGGPRGGAAGLSDDTKLQQLSTLLETDSESLRGSSATDVVKRLQDKGIDLSRLRSVLNSGDLVDYAA